MGEHKRTEGKTTKRWLAKEVKTEHGSVEGNEGVCRLVVTEDQSI